MLPPYVVLHVYRDFQSIFRKRLRDDRHKNLQVGISYIVGYTPSDECNEMTFYDILHDSGKLCT